MGRLLKTGLSVGEGDGIRGVIVMDANHLVEKLKQSGFTRGPHE